MARPSLAALSVVPVDSGRSRIEPPDSLHVDEKKVFRDIVSACEPHHFTSADMPLMVEYARACVQASNAAWQLMEGGAVVDGKLSPWLAVQEKAHKSMVALSARLRVCPQSRFDRTTAGARSRPTDGGKQPWEFEG